MNNSIETYKIFADFYDLYAGKFNADLDFYRSYCHKTDNVLEIGCGTGRILNILLQAGCKVTGVDISREMLDKANAKFKNWINNGKLTLINHNFVTDKLNNRFDKVLLTFYTFNYILDNPVGFLKNIHNSLNDHGLLLMDLFYPNSLYDKSIDGKWINKEFNVDGQEINIRDCRTMDHDIEHRQQIFDINGRETRIDTRRKYYSPVYLKELLHSAGYRNIEFSYNYNYEGFKAMINESELKTNYIVKVEK